MSKIYTEASQVRMHERTQRRIHRAAELRGLTISEYKRDVALRGFAAIMDFEEAKDGA